MVCLGFLHYVHNLTFVVCSSSESWSRIAPAADQQQAGRHSIKQSYVYYTTISIASNLLLILIVAYAFALLWTIRNHRDPDRFPLPLGLRLGRAIFTNNPTIGGISHYTNLLIYRNGAPTRLGAAVWEAWQRIGAIDRELMLFCWTVKQAIRYDWSRIAHPAPTFQSASLLLSSDLEQEEALPLRHRAIQLISES